MSMKHDIVESYIHIAQAIARVLCRKFDVRFPLQPYRHYRIKRGGLNRHVTFDYHGIGCRFEFATACSIREIDIDFEEDRIILDPWKIGLFATENFAVSIEGAVIDRCLRGLQTQLGGVWIDKKMTIPFFRCL